MGFIGSLVWQCLGTDGVGVIFKPKMDMFELDEDFCNCTEFWGSLKTHIRPMVVRESKMDVF